jgi:putative endonuclease
VSLARGRQAEDAALALLLDSGLRLVERNYRCRLGEIDLVMSDGPVLVFVEVRSRATTRFPSAWESVGPRKQARLTAAARHFVARHPQVAERPMRFDVVAISASGTDNETRWIRGAFDAAGSG